VSRQRAIALFGRDRIADAWDGWLTDKRRPDSDPEELPDVATWKMEEQDIVRKPEGYPDATNARA